MVRWKRWKRVRPGLYHAVTEFKLKRRKTCAMCGTSTTLAAAVEAFLSDTGICSDAEDEESVCNLPDCRYCALARAAQPEYYPEVKHDCLPGR